MKTSYEKSNLDITNNIVVGLLFMMIMSANFAFGQAVNLSGNSKKAIAIVSNNNATYADRPRDDYFAYDFGTYRVGNGLDEYIYFRSGSNAKQRTLHKWYTESQFIVADDWVGTRKPLRFLTSTNLWEGSGEQILNTRHAENGSARGYGLTFIANGHEVLTLRKGRKGDPSLHLGGPHDEGWSRIGANGAIAFWTNGKSNADGSPQLLLKDGNLYVGANIPVNPLLKEKFDLFVRHGVLAEDFAIGKAEYWSDYVFEKDYKLRPISEVEQFIEKNKHLPNIPSKEAIGKDGYSMHDMKVLFLEKIEELTLYTIQNEKLIKKLSDRLDSFTE